MKTVVQPHVAVKQTIGETFEAMPQVGQVLERSPAIGDALTRPYDRQTG
jgi:hypothetical protein